ncbi:Crp/Fnr family transcriptional regulator [Candidatus Viridilinea mediisalina]|uniref:Cyclic nucleotide-binding protein n=1 Tax=Candidatus Viridilinea mediisalina TaxID=2024553 RepID=A0A2A6RKB5_9CHLR|nr:Crp/Fnr family transcriptional regulator [Candidatus Viridilinea mediisalina]PDW03554.1 cyclic nucleotide-binding protein [Candidatus Viridilinea mediisalina]
MVASASDASPQHVLHAAIERLGSGQNFRRHSYVYTPNQPAHALYLLLSGQIGLQMFSSEGRTLTIKVVEPGQVFGHSALAGGNTYDTYAQALQSARVVAVARGALLAASATTPGLSMALLELLGQQRQTLSRRIEEVAFKSVPARLASVLLEMSGDQAHHPQPQQHVGRRTHQQLAEMVNAYRETVTKVLNQFRDAHLLDVDRTGITLLNLSRLRELAQG